MIRRARAGSAARTAATSRSAPRVSSGAATRAPRFVVAGAAGLKSPSAGGLKLEARPVRRGRRRLLSVGGRREGLQEVATRSRRRRRWPARTREAVWRAPRTPWSGPPRTTCLYVADPKRAALAIRVFDEDVAKRRPIAGVGEIPLSRAFSGRRAAVDRRLGGGRRGQDRVRRRRSTRGAVVGAAAGLATGGVALAAMATAGLRENEHAE